MKEIKKILCGNFVCAIFLYHKNIFVKKQGEIMGTELTKTLTKGKPGKVIFYFSLPVIAGNLFQLFYTMADTVIVGRTMGADALAAVGSTTVVIYLILCFIQGVTGGYGIVTAQNFGAKNEKGVRQSIGVSLIQTFIFTIIITVISCMLTITILEKMNTPQDIFKLSYDYMIVVFIGTGATFYYNLFSNILRALGDSKTPLYFLVLSSILNIFLDILFIVPLKMGVAGAAWATVLSQLISAVLCLFYALKFFPVTRLKKEDWKFDKKVHLKNLKIAFPMGFQMSVMCIGQLAMQAAVNKIGTNAIAGYTAASKVDQMSVLVNNAFGITISNYVAQNFGAGLIGRIKKGVKSCMMITHGANLLMAVFILGTQSLIIPIFMNEPNEEIFMYAKDYLWVIVPFYLLLGMVAVYRSSVQSMGDSVTPFLACIIELFARIFCALYLSIFLGYKGICFSTPFAWLTSLCLIIPVYYMTIKKLTFEKIKGYTLNMKNIKIRKV